MKITKKDLPKSQALLNILLDEKESQNYRGRAVQKLSQTVKISGFRKGKVPEKILVERYGEGVLLQEAIDIAIPKLLTAAIIKHELSPITRPAVDVKSVSPIEIEATITLLPTVKMDEQWKTKMAEKKAITVTKKEIEEVIENLRERQIERVIIDRSAKKGDFIEIDFSGKTPDGVPLDGTSSKRHPMVLGSNTFIPGFEEQLIGLKKDEEKEFEITFPEDYRAPHLAGKPVVFAVKMLEVFEQKKPVVDKKFAKEIFGKEMTKEEIYAEVKTMLLEKAEEEERNRRENDILEQWEKCATIELPDLLVDEEVENMMRIMKQQTTQGGGKWEDYLAQMKKTEEDLKTERRPDGEKRARQRLIIGTLLNTETITVSEEEVHAALHDGHAHGANHDHDHDSEEWQQATHRAKVQKLFDTFLEEKKDKEEKK